MPAAVKLTNVVKRFGILEVLKGVSFEINTGEVVALIGQSGSGKSTALRCINRLETIQDGTIEVCGHHVEDPKLDLRALRRDIGMVFQSYNLFPHMTVAQNIMLALRRVKNIRKDEAYEISRQVLAKVGLMEKIDNYPEQLSGGQQQRVAIARSLAMQPKVMLFDEVTSALDPKLTGEVLRVMEDPSPRRHDHDRRHPRDGLRQARRQSRHLHAYRQGLGDRRGRHPFQSADAGAEGVHG